MHPALSVIFFTVLSGLGYGLFMALAVAGMFGLPRAVAAPAGAVALALVTVGLLCSTLHLANPKNAWRAFGRFRTSWLSREGVFALLFYPPALAWLAWPFAGAAAGAAWLALSVVVFAGALATVFSTGMIYACLKTIPQWHTPLTPANYILFALATGALGLVFFQRLAGAPTDDAMIIGASVDDATMTIASIDGATLVLAVALVALAALFKLMHYAWMGPARGPSINTATGFTRATVRLLDVGHTAGTFLTEEFGYALARRRARQLRVLALALLFAAPAPALLCDAAWAAGAALAAAVGGAFVERWLFFAEARHVVNLYHGAARV